MKAINIIFSQEPGPGSHFIEVEGDDGNSISVGEWSQREDGYWCLRIDQQIGERIAQITAHRVCCGSEHDPENGKLHGHCVVCGVPWPCAYQGTTP